MANRDSWALPIETFEVSISDVTVLRLARKSFAGGEVLDLRLWGRGKKGNLYPKRQGLCMRSSFWELALKLFKDNSLPIPNDATTNS